MTKETMQGLLQLNKLSLTEDEKNDVLSFIDELEKGEDVLSEINTEGLKVLVHLSELSDLYNVLREDKKEKVYTKEQLQEQAPEAYEGYWQVPRLVD